MSLAILYGYQAILFAIFTKVFAISEGLMPADQRLARFLKIVTLERGLAIAATTIGIGQALLVAAINQWRVVEFGSLNYVHTMRFVIPGVTLSALGFQTMLSSFLGSVLRMHRR